MRVFIHYLFYWLVTFLAFATQVNANDKRIAIIDTPYEENASHQYFVDLVHFLLDVSREKYGEATIELYYAENNTHEKTLNLISTGLLDLSWAGTTKNLERKLLPIRIPLLGGLLGYRVSIIRKDDHDKFSKASVEQFKSMIACQGQVWGDSDILEDNGYNVMRISRFDLMFKMLAHGRCDYFPRAVYEGYNELNAIIKKYPNLMMFDDKILHYQFPLYFFVEPQNIMLAERLRYALNKAIDDGSFIAFMQRHPLTEAIFPIEKWSNKNIIRLHNRFLPAETPIKEAKYWLQLSEY
ncbi:MULTISPECIES: type 2 periplasmic-binding domain-containing protein [Thalassotalea]|uniref:hypothetical protein n=1 Tax=Thalassotalea TaxID=1518149 RepID=UPI0009FA92DC|nr:MULTISPECIES: hypothetical protein [Thalassotalea]